MSAQTGDCIQTRTFAIVGSSSGRGFKKQLDQAFLNSETIQVYPNPVTSNQVLIELPADLTLEAPLLLKVRDMNGKIVSELTSVEHIISLNTQNMSNGIYTIFIQSKDSIVTKKVIIQR